MEKYKGTSQYKFKESVISVSNCVLNIKEIDLKIAHRISGTTFYDFNTLNCSYKNFEEKIFYKEPRRNSKGSF